MGTLWLWSLQCFCFFLNLISHLKVILQTSVSSQGWKRCYGCIKNRIGTEVCIFASLFLRISHSIDKMPFSCFSGIRKWLYSLQRSFLPVSMFAGTKMSCVCLSEVHRNVCSNWNNKPCVCAYIIQVMRTQAFDFKPCSLPCVTLTRVFFLCVKCAHRYFS